MGEPAVAVGVAPEDQAYVRSVVTGARTSFFWAMRLLPRARREAMYAVYAFCREVDDVADGALPLTEKLAALEAWRDQVMQLFHGRPASPVMRALAGPVSAFGLDRDDFERLIDGMEMDARGPIAAPSLAALETYCDCVAGAVGRLSVRVFGLSGRASRDLAFSLGQALQLTNILRDLGEDALVGRLYLPAEWLARHGVPAGLPAAEAIRLPAIDAVCRDVAVLARRRFAEARAALDQLARRPARPAVVMMEVYERLLDRLCRRGWADPTLPVGLSRAEKLWLAVRHGLL